LGFEANVNLGRFGVRRLEFHYMIDSTVTSGRGRGDVILETVEVSRSLDAVAEFPDRGQVLTYDPHADHVIESAEGEIGVGASDLSADAVEPLEPDADSRSVRHPAGVDYRKSRPEAAHTERSIALHVSDTLEILRRLAEGVADAVDRAEA